MIQTSIPRRIQTSWVSGCPMLGPLLNSGQAVVIIIKCTVFPPMAMLEENLVLHVQALQARSSLNDITNKAVGVGFTTVDRSFNPKEGSPRVSKWAAEGVHSFDVAERQRLDAGVENSPHQDRFDIGFPNRIVAVGGKICLEVLESELDAQREIEAKQSCKPTVFIRRKDIILFRRHSLQVFLCMDSLYNAILGSKTLPLESTELARVSYDPELYDRHAVLVLVEELFPPECKGIAANRVYFRELGVFALSHGRRLPKCAGRTAFVFKIYPLPDTRPQGELVTLATTIFPFEGKPTMTDDHSILLREPDSAEYELVGSKLRLRFPDVPQDF
ncbi:hypothetical protein E1B28_011757 [Marasmius oreades]|uniref:Uncharacterized protein n=1 Tax=Marasmius oreades TaxID=181124 RepID=A0A9P7RUT1_9AGAR|nr:uncharacterized protein E1B28_011757 [Marasmius oreades]KAG7090149.1 hypothetical protein E1B28_011757 [Marasmius oreades]